MIGLLGPRGVGKTTLVLQYIKENLDRNASLYVTAEDFYFATHRLLDLADAFSKAGGKYLFIDEIHKYKDWSRELKLMYDYHSELKVVFTGSSVLDINKGISDLSRRAAMYTMQGLSFREYLRQIINITLESDIPQYADMNVSAVAARAALVSAALTFGFLICTRGGIHETFFYYACVLKVEARFQLGGRGSGVVSACFSVRTPEGGGGRAGFDSLG